MKLIDYDSLKRKLTERCHHYQMCSPKKCAAFMQALIILESEPPVITVNTNETITIVKSGGIDDADLRKHQE